SFSAVSGHPSINLYQAYETNGGTLYLTDTNIANVTVTNRAYSSSLGTVSASQGLLFPANFFAGTNSYLLFEGAGTGGEGQLTLTIQKGTNVLAQTSAWLDLRDVQDLIEHAYTQKLSLDDPPVTNSGTFKLLNSPDSGPAEDKQIILYVHGLNH